MHRSRTLTRKFPLTDLPTGLMAALVTRLADHLLMRRVIRRAGGRVRRLRERRCTGTNRSGAEPATGRTTK